MNDMRARAMRHITQHTSHTSHIVARCTVQSVYNNKSINSNFNTGRPRLCNNLATQHGRPVLAASCKLHITNHSGRRYASGAGEITDYRSQVHMAWSMQIDVVEAR